MKLNKSAISTLQKFSIGLERLRFAGEQTGLFWDNEDGRILWLAVNQEGLITTGLASSYDEAKDQIDKWSSGVLP